MEAALIISLTTEEACVQCAAFEAIATENAYLTSNKNALISLLGRSAIYTENNAADIVHGVDIALNNRAALIADMKRLKISLEELFEEGLQEIRQMIF